MKNQQDHARHHVALILTVVGLISAVSMMMIPTRRATAQGVAASWSYTGNLNRGRDSQTATLLPNGKVLVTA